MTRRRPLSQVIGALLLLMVLLPPAARGEEPAVSLGVQGETGWWGREESGPGVGLAQRPVSEWRFTLTPRLSLWGYELSSRILLTSLNDALAEAQNRLQLELKGERFGVAVGDNFTADHPLVARGARIRGVSGYARPNEHYSVSLFYGRTRRANEGDYDSTAARVSRFGNYERRVLNINATVEVRRGLTIGASAAVGEDRENSIAYGRTPRKATTIGGEARYAFPTHKAEITLAVGRSESEVAATDFDSTAGEIDPAWAWRVDGRVTVARQDLSASYYRIGSAYESFAAPTLTPDREGLSVKDQLSILTGRVRLQAGYERYHDNVGAEDSVTLTVSRPSGSVSLRLKPVLDQLDGSLGYRITENDLAKGAPGYKDARATDWRVNAARQFIVGSGHRLGLTAGWMQSDIEDQANASAGYKRSGGQAGFKGQFGGYDLLISISHHTTDYVVENRDTQKQFSGALVHKLVIRRVWEISADQRYSVTRSGGSETGRRWQAGGAVTRFLAGRSLALSASYDYIDFASETNSATDFHGHSMYVKLATVGVLNLIDSGR